MKNTVFFASWFNSNSQDRLNRCGIAPIEKIRSSFPANTRIIIGINPPVQSEWLDYLSTLNNVEIVIVENDKVIDSDSSAYQACLKYYKDNPDDSDLMWFNHTKYSSHPESHCPNGYFDYYLYYDGVVKKFEKDKIGGYTVYCTLTTDKSPIESLNKFADFPCSGSFFLPLHSMYTIRSSIVKDFLNKCDSSFFENLLDQGFDRYFFERDFSSIVHRYGFEWDWVVPIQHCNSITSISILNEFNRWRQENKLL